MGSFFLVVISVTSILNLGIPGFSFSLVLFDFFGVPQHLDAEGLGRSTGIITR